MEKKRRQRSRASQAAYEARKKSEAERSNRRIGRLLKRAREGREIPQQEVADWIGVSQAHISKMEKGSVTISPYCLMKYCGILKVSIDYLLIGRIIFNPKAKPTLAEKLEWNREQRIINRRVWYKREIPKAKR